VRDVAFALGPFEVLIDEVGDIQLRAWVLENHLQEGLDMLRAAKLQMETMIDWVGPYPYTELDLVDAPGAFGGIEYPGLVYIGTVGTEWLIEPTVHEVAHQWFYGLIGDDQLYEPWLDEAAATYAEALYFERASFNATRTNFLADLRGVVRLRSTAELPIGMPVGEYPNANEYAIIVYFKGALFFDELRLRLGEQSFKAFLQSYFNQNRYQIATAIDFQQAAEGVCECDLQALFDLWVYEGGPVPGF
jgi:aminopeptidase N